jgi:MoxR-like ATPase
MSDLRRPHSPDEAARDDCFEQARLALDPKSALPGVNVCFHGPSSFGKTYLATRWGLAEGEIVISITLTEQTSAADLRGFYVQGPKCFVWMDGPLVRALRVPCRVVLNELGAVTDDAAQFLLGWLDDPRLFRLHLPNGETIENPKIGRVVATANQSPDRLPEALRSRFPVRVHIDRPNPEIIASFEEPVRNLARNLLTSKRAKDTRLAGVYNVLDDVDMRMLISFNELFKANGFEHAARVLFGPQGVELCRGMMLAQAS